MEVVIVVEINHIILFAINKVITITLILELVNLVPKLLAQIVVIFLLETCVSKMNGFMSLFRIVLTVG